MGKLNSTGRKRQTNAVASGKSYEPKLVATMPWLETKPPASAMSAVAVKDPSVQQVLPMSPEREPPPVARPPAAGKNPAAIVREPPMVERRPMVDRSPGPSPVAFSAPATNPSQTFQAQVIPLSSKDGLAMAKPDTSVTVVQPGASLNAVQEGGDDELRLRRGRARGSSIQNVGITL